MLRSLVFTLLMLFISTAIFAQSKPYRGAEYRTKDKFRYGRFEVRMKSAQVSGMLASFFTFHDSTTFSSDNWNELDIEIMGRHDDQVQFNAITPGESHHLHEQLVEFNPHEAFHIYAIEWTPHYVAWWVDSVEIYRQTGDHVQTLFRGQKLMMNIWQPVYEDWAGAFSESSLPVYAYYDWVRVYAYTPGINDNFTLQWQDDFDTWDKSRWDKATHTFDGNNCQFVYSNAVFQDGYLILCITMPGAEGYNGNAVVDTDVDAPYAVAVHGFDDEIKIRFSEDPEEASAENTSNYLISAFAVNSATLGPDNRTVILETDGRDPQLSYSMVLTGIGDLADPANKMQPQFYSIPASRTLPLQINLGGDESNGYLSDQIWDFHKTYGRVGGNVEQHSVSKEFANTDDDVIYRTECRGLHFYNFRIPNGTYKLTLRFAETEYAAAGKRVFDIYANNQKIKENLDIFAESGANAALDIVADEITVSDHFLEIYLAPVTGAPVLSGIKLEKMTTAIERPVAPPKDFRMHIYPNPFNPAATIAVNLPEAQDISVKLFNAAGQRISEIFVGHRPAGMQQFILDGRGLASGVYYCSLRAGGRLLAVKKVVLIK